MNKYLRLADAIATWNQGEHNNNWCIRTPAGELLFELNGKFDEQMAMQAIHLGRIFETKAFENGVLHGRTLQKQVDMNELVQLRAAVKELGQLNESLSEQLERHMNKV